MIKLYKFLVGGAAVLALAACGAKPVGLAPAIQQVASDTLPYPDGYTAGSGYNYTLGEFDQVSVEVTGLPDLRRELRVDAQGMVSFPLAGAVKAEGLTPVQLASQIESRLAEAHVREPQVSVGIMEMVSNRLSVSGQVKQPGFHPARRGMTLMEAVSQAGGDSDVAKASEVLIFREAGGQRYVGLYNLEGIRRGNYADPLVFPGDDVVVSESHARRFMQSLAGLTGLITTPLVLLLQDSN